MIKRTVFISLKAHLAKKEISFLVGPRQAGKTFLMRLLFDQLQKNGEKAVFFNLDIEMDKTFFTSQNSLLRKIRLEIGSQKGFVFIDEIQRKGNAGLFLKGLYDMNTPYKFIVSGSGSLELKEKIHESLSGRKRIFEIRPLSFTEFANYKTNYHYEEKLSEFFALEQDKTYELLDEYMAFGGYPRVVLAQTIEEKQAEMKEIYQSYLERDIRDLLNIEKTEAFTNLVKIIASQIGGLVNATELSSTIGISNKTIQKYLWFLEKTFIVQKLTPYFQNVRKEITKMPIYYFCDLGLRNYILGLFGVPTVTLLSGHLFENFILDFLGDKINFASSRIHFWRTRDGAEVDFVIEVGLHLIPVEAKYTKLAKAVVPRSLLSFIARYHPEKAFIVYLGRKQKVQIEKTRVFFVQFTEIDLSA